MNNIPISVLGFTLLALICLSAFFSSSETALMAVNRYKLKSLSDKGHKSATLVLRLLQTPDRILGTILFGNNVANIAATTLATILGLKISGDIGAAYATLLLTFIVLIFAEVAPKTLAATRPEKIAFIACWVLAFLQILLYPFVWLVKLLSNGVLRLLGVQKNARNTALSTEELRAAVNASSEKLDASHQEILLRALELQDISVADIMVPRMRIEAIDITDDWDEIITQLTTSRHTHIPVFEEALDNLIGITHIGKVLYLSQTQNFNKEALKQDLHAPYFIPENAALTQVLKNFKQQKQRFGVVVDEYGDIKGLITLEQILEEVVGKFTPIIPHLEDDIRQEDENHFLVHGNTSLRDINRQLHWQLPSGDAKTINGLIFEKLEDIPQPNTSLKINNYIIEIVQMRDTSVQLARISQWNQK